MKADQSRNRVWVVTWAHPNSSSGELTVCYFYVYATFWLCFHFHLFELSSSKALFTQMVLFNSKLTHYITYSQVMSAFQMMLVEVIVTYLETLWHSVNFPTFSLTSNIFTASNLDIPHKFLLHRKSLLHTNIIINISMAVIILNITLSITLV